MNLKALIIVIATVIISPASIAAELYVVVSNNLRGHSFSADEVRRILLGEMYSVDNARINLIYPSYTSAEIETVSKFVGKGGSVRNLKSYWSKMIFTGRGTPPQTANNEEELKQMIERDNSIGVSTVSTGLNVVYTIND